MNNLSWLIYAAEVVGNIGSGLGGTSALLLIVGGISSTFATVGYFVTLGDRHAQDTNAGLRKAMKLTYPIFILGLVIGLVSQFIPSRNAVYAIAASEMGEVVVKTPEAQEVLQALKGKIMEQLEPATKE